MKERAVWHGIDEGIPGGRAGVVESADLSAMDYRRQAETVVPL